MIKLFMKGRVGGWDAGGYSEKCLKRGGNLEQNYLRTGGRGKARKCLLVTEDLEGVTTPAPCMATEKL